MRYILAIIFCLFFFVRVSFAEEQDSAAGSGALDNSPVEKFNAKFFLGMNAKFNFAIFGAGREIEAESNAPVYIGLSFGYKDYSLFFSIAQKYTYTQTPGKRAAFDGTVTFYQKRWFEEAQLRFYDDFKTNDTPYGKPDNPFDLRFISGNLLGEYVFNSDNFSLQSVYPMNRIQRKSAGSFMAGGNVRIASIKPPDISLNNEKALYVSAGPNAGYSYTFIMGNLFFINLFILSGINFGIETTEHQFAFLFSLSTRIAAGKHFKSWSVNFVLQPEYLSFLDSSRPHNFFAFTSASLGFSKRF
ncbi:MAG: DUF4421 domain-containing protein [Spirochaetaceae bacterium]|jgi:hypothetical protein|nr:DUF4421 domain-containing protein [Spirochaetaceae bacterium]